MTLGEKIKYIRKDLGMSQDTFGSTLEVSRDVINSYEHDRIKNISNAFLRLLCITHRVNYFWLTENKGEPYVGIPEIIVDEAVEEYQLDETDKSLIEEYVKLDPQIRDSIKGYLKNVFKNAPD